MTAPHPDEEPSVLRRLIRDGARVRPLSERERNELVDELHGRVVARAAAQTARRRAAIGVACTIVVGLSLATLDFDAARTAEAPRPATAEPARAVSPAPRDDAGARAPAPAPLRLPRRVSLAGRGEITLEADAVARLPEGVATRTAGPVQIDLEQGQLSASVAPRRRDEPLSIVTPQVAVVVIGTRFSVTVLAGVTTVRVMHGRVRVERAGQSVFVDGGGSLRSDDPRFVAASDARGAALCTDRKQRRRCLRRVARGSDLAAENALFALALLDHDEQGRPETALSHLHAYEHRFPRGVLSAEVALTVVRIHREQGHAPEACAAAQRYAQRFADAPSTLDKLQSGCVPVREPGSEAR